MIWLPLNWPKQPHKDYVIERCRMPLKCCMYACKQANKQANNSNNIEKNATASKNKSNTTWHVQSTTMSGHNLIFKWEGRNSNFIIHPRGDEQKFEFIPPWHISMTYQHDMFSWHISMIYQHVKLTTPSHASYES
jgi:hypothetical protein